MAKPPIHIRSVLGYEFRRAAQAPDQGMIVIHADGDTLYLTQDKARLLKFGQAVVAFASSLGEPTVKH